MKKQILAAILALVLIVVSIAGCNKSKTEVVPTPAPDNLSQEVSGTVEGEGENATDDSVVTTPAPSKEPESTPDKPQTTPQATQTPTATPIQTPTPEPTPEATSAPSVSLQDLMASMVSALPSETCSLSEIPADMYEGVYGINPANFEDVLVYGSMMNVHANEIILIKAKDAANLEEAKNLLADRLAALEIQWEHYLPSQYELVKAGSVNSKGLYAALVVADGAKKAVSVFNSTIK